MNRYSVAKPDVRFDGKRTFKSVIYPNIREDNSDKFIVTNETMYLDTLAFKYYKDPSYWWIIALANNIGQGKLSVESGKQIRIPGNLSKIMADYIELNS